MSEFPAQLKYTKDHEWISALSGSAEIGVSEYAITQLGDIVYIELPKIGATLKAGGAFGTIESTKTVSDLYSPVAGTVIGINDKLVKQPDQLQKDCYKQGWLIKIEVDKGQAVTGLMDSKEYTAYIEEH